MPDLHDICIHIMHCARITVMFRFGGVRRTSCTGPLLSWRARSSGWLSWRKRWVCEVQQPQERSQILQQLCRCLLAVHACGSCPAGLVNMTLLPVHDCVVFPAAVF